MQIDSISSYRSITQWFVKPRAFQNQEEAVWDPNRLTRFKGQPSSLKGL